MQVIHLYWQMAKKAGEESGMFLWSETAVSTQPKRDRRKKTVQPHNFPGKHSDLDRIVRHILPWHKQKLSQQSNIIWLPTNKFGPTPSSELIHDWEIDSEPSKLQPWIVSGLHLNVDDAFDLLLALQQRGESQNLHNGAAFRLGGDARYWQQSFNLILEILAQQKLRPMMVEVRDGGETGYEARWQPILDSEQDAQRLTHLANMMPAACRAVAPNPAETIPPRAILDNYLNHITDAAARRWGAEQELYLPTGSNPAERWLRALFAIKPEVTGSQAQLQHLYSSYRAWERTLTIAGDRHFRVAFRLEAPAIDTDPDQWWLHYLLQARDDASLIVPAEAVWQAGSGIMESLGRKFERPQERLLTGLGYAGRFFPPIERSLHNQNPSVIHLTTTEAFEFLRHCAPQLEQSGFGILTPPWWNKPGTRLGVRLSLGSNMKKGETAVSRGHMQLNKLINYQWQLSLGDTSLTQAEFNALVALKSPLVQIRGQWVQLDPEQIEAAIQFWKKQKALEGEISLHEAMQLGLGGEETHNGLPIDSVNLDDWLQDWLNKLQGDEKLELLPPPAKLHANLRPYQQYGYSWLDFTRRWGMGVILADDMGLGKTIQTLTMVQKLKDELGKLPAPILLICPTSVVTNWQLESDKFTPDLKTIAHQGGDRLREEAFINAAQDVDMVLTSYALVRRDGETMQQIDWLGIVLDEAQNIKNASTKQAQTIRKLPAEFRIALTGTPVENRLSELWSIMHFLNPGYLGSQKRFKKDFTLPIEKYGDEDATKKLRQLTRPFILRRLKTDPTVITDLPEKQEVKVFCTLSEEQATLYQAVVGDALANIEAQEGGGIARKGLVLSMLMQLKQICNHPFNIYIRVKPTILLKTIIVVANCVGSTPFWMKC